MGRCPNYYLLTLEDAALEHGAALGGRGGRGRGSSGSGGRGIVAGADDDETEHGLGDDVKDGVGEGLLVGGKAVVALGHEPDHGVEDPGDDGDVGDLVVDSGAARLELVELHEDGHEHDHAKAPEVVLLLALEESANEAR